MKILPLKLLLNHLLIRVIRAILATASRLWFNCFSEHAIFIAAALAP